MRRGKVAEDELRAFLFGGFRPDLVNLRDGLVQLGIGMVADAGHHEPEVERSFAALGRDLQHVVVARIDLPAFDLLHSRDEVLDETL